MEDKLTQLKDVKDSDNLEEIKKRLEAVTTELNNLSQKLYQQNGAQPGAEGQAQGQAKSDDDVVDADYEVVDDDDEENRK